MASFHCNTCKKRVNADVLTKGDVYYTPDDWPDMQIDWADVEYEVLQCRGCGHLAFRESWTNSEDWSLDEGPEKHVVLYPEPLKEDQRARREFENVPPNLARIYGEVMGAFNGGYLTLCAAGLRALIEGICVDKGIEEGPVRTQKADGTRKIVVRNNLQGKIGGMAAKRILGRNHAEILHRFRFLGNDAVHELKTPKRSSLIAALDIVEHTLENVYELEDRAQRIA